MVFKGKWKSLLLCTCMSLFTAACSGYNNTSIPNVPYHNIDVHKQTHLMTDTDRVCVFNGGDMITDTGTRYRNSGRFMYEILYVTMQQYNVEGAVGLGAFDLNSSSMIQLQEVSRNNHCNIIAVSKPIFWKDSQITIGNVGLKVDMYDTSSLELLNSVTLNARSQYIRDMFKPNTPLRPVIEKYVDNLYRQSLSHD